MPMFEPKAHQIFQKIACFTLNLANGFQFLFLSR